MGGIDGEEREKESIVVQGDCPARVIKVREAVGVLF
jgi:hypothetical protein